MWAPIDLIPAFFFDVKFLVMCWKFPFSAKGGESGGRPLVDGSLDYSSLIQHPPTPSIDTERSPINVTVALGKTALLTCRIRGFNNRTVNRQQKKNYFFETIRVDMCTMKLVSQIKGLLDYNSLCIGPVCWQSPCRLEAQREEDGEKVTSYDSSSLVGPISLTLRWRFARANLFLPTHPHLDVSNVWSSKLLRRQQRPLHSIRLFCFFSFLMYRSLLFLFQCKSASVPNYHAPITRNAK